MNQILVLDTHVNAIDYRGQRVATTQMVSDLHRISVQNVRNNFTNNRDRFVEGRDFFRLEGEELQSFRNYIGNLVVVNPKAPSLILFTERGYMKLATTFRDDRSWALIDAMTDAYFAVREIIQSPPTPTPLSIPERIDSLKSMLYLAEEIGLSDDFTRIIARETLHNMIRAVGNPGGYEQAQIPQHSDTSNYFQVESLRDEICSTTGLGSKKWFNMRGAIGKAIRASIQAADPDAEPLKVHKNVNGDDRPVNAWHSDYRDIALQAAIRYVERSQKGA